jgi:hypothetical protein
MALPATFLRYGLHHWRHLLRNESLDGRAVLFTSPDLVIVDAHERYVFLIITVTARIILIP